MSLLHEIETCLRLTNEPPSRFGRHSAKDPRLVHDLRRGRQPGPSLERRVQAYILQQIANLPDTPAQRRALRRSAALIPTRARTPDERGRP
jgi:hypothetical protein